MRVLIMAWSRRAEDNATMVQFAIAPTLMAGRTSASDIGMQFITQSSNTSSPLYVRMQSTPLLSHLIPSSSRVAVDQSPIINLPLVIFKLDLDLSNLPSMYDDDLDAFASQVDEDIWKAAWPSSMAATRVAVMALDPGSIIVTYTIAPPLDESQRPSTTAIDNFITAVANPDAVIYFGAATRYTMLGSAELLLAVGPRPTESDSESYLIPFIPLNDRDTIIVICCAGVFVICMIALMIHACRQYCCRRSLTAEKAAALQRQFSADTMTLPDTDTHATSMGAAFDAGVEMTQQGKSMVRTQSMDFMTDDDADGSGNGNGNDNAKEYGVRTGSDGGDGGVPADLANVLIESSMELQRMEASHPESMATGHTLMHMHTHTRSHFSADVHADDPWQTHNPTAMHRNNQADAMKSHTLPATMQPATMHDASMNESHVASTNGWASPTQPDADPSAIVFPSASTSASASVSSSLSSSHPDSIELSSIQRRPTVSRPATLRARTTVNITRPSVGRRATTTTRTNQFHTMQTTPSASTSTSASFAPPPLLSSWKQSAAGNGWQWQWQWEWQWQWQWQCFIQFIRFLSCAWCLHSLCHIDESITCRRAHACHSASNAATARTGRRIAQRMTTEKCQSTNRSTINM